MDPQTPFSDAPVCAQANSNACDLVFNLTGKKNLALAAEWIIGKPLAILGLIVLGLLARWLLHRLIDRVTARAAEGVLPPHIGKRRFGRAGEEVPVSPATASARRAQRAKTMGSLLKNMVTAVILTIVVVMVVSELGYDIAPLIASAGIVGVALGFGAQSLVKDYLAGIFMIFEDQLGVGDVVDLGEAIGTVEAVSLRITRLRDVDGTVWYVRNGEILRVGNQSQNWARTVLDINVAYGEDLHRVQRVLREVAHDLWEDEDYKDIIIEEPEVWGVQSLNPDSISVRVTLKTAPLEQWGVARTMRERIKARFDFEGIEIPYAQRVIWQREGDSRAQDGAAMPPGTDTQEAPGGPGASQKV